MEVYIDAQGQERPERRRNEKLRGVFPYAAERLRQFFHDRADWPGSSQDYLALRVIHEHYPTLSAEEVRRLVTAVGRQVNPDGTSEGLTA